MTRAPLASPLAHVIIGHDAPRIDAIPKVKGEAQFAGDLRVPGMAYGRILRSPFATRAS
jgi:nicotinate dehydrogenase subunit B